MLTHRTNVLLTQNDYKMLTSLAKKQNKTHSQLIRKAINKTYRVKKEKTTKQKFEEMQKILKKTNFTGTDYKGLIAEGRKY